MGGIRFMCSVVCPEDRCLGLLAPQLHLPRSTEAIVSTATYQPNVGGLDHETRRDHWRDPPARQAASLATTTEPCCFW